MKNKYLHIRISAEQQKALQELADNNGLTVSAFLRMIITREINKSKE